MSKRNLRDILLTGGVIGAIAIGLGGTSYMERTRDAKIHAIMTGEIHGNKDSFIYHVPTCPEYDSIKPSNLRSFATVADAEAANYRPSRNCLEAATTRNINETEIDEGPDGGHDDPRY